MRLIFTLALLSVATLHLKAQQDPQYTQWMYDKLSFNPGVAGSEGANCLSAFFRRQWTGFEGSPQNILLNYHGPVKLLRGGLGITFYNDQLGQETNNIVRLNYSYHLKLSSGTLGLGVGLGLLQKKLGNSWLTPEVLPEFDPSINTANVAAGTFDLNFGAYYWTPKFYVGLSSTHLTEGSLEDLSIEVARHYYLMGGYNAQITPDITLRPNLLVKSDAQKHIFDLNVNALHSTGFWLGASYRLQDAIAPMLGYQTTWMISSPTSDFENSVRIGYSYDLTTSEIKTYSSGSHEIMLTYCFNFIPKIIVKPYSNPRFL